MTTTHTVETPAHLRPSSCYVCGSTEPHADTTARGGHRFWSNADAEDEFMASSWPCEYPVEARYVEQTRGR